MSESRLFDSGHLRTQANSLVKQRCFYDAFSRLEYVYTVRADATNGTPCSVVRYGYDGVTPKVIYMKEYAGEWDGAWDLF